MSTAPLPSTLKADRVIDLADRAATNDLAVSLAGLLRAGDFIGLGGVLGAGKTSLARDIIECLAGHDVEAPSPSFTLVQTYDYDDFILWHFDLYRIETPEAVYELGFEDALDGGVSLVEWPERLGALLPDDRLDVTLLQGPTPDARIACLTAHAAHGAHDAWRARLDALIHG